MYIMANSLSDIIEDNPIWPLWGRIKTDSRLFGDLRKLILFTNEVTNLFHSNAKYRLLC